MQETTIKIFSGLSTDTKPTAASGYKIPNGSRFREVNTEITYFYNESDDTWYQFGNRVDRATHATTVIDHAHHEIHSGSHFKRGYGVVDQSLVTDDTVSVLFVTPDTAKWAHFELTAASTGFARIVLYEGVATSSDGTPITPQNRNRNSLTASVISTYHTPTVTNYGSTWATKFIGGEGFKTTIGGEKRGESEIILKQNTKYLILGTALADNISLQVGGDWYEHEDKD